MSANAWDQFVSTLPAEHQKWAEAVCDLAGTSDADGNVFAAAAKLLCAAHAVTEIALASTDDLINELLARYEHGVFCALRILTDDETTIVRRWKGNAVTCAGLGTEAAHAVLADLEQRSERKATP